MILGILFGFLSGVLVTEQQRFSACEKAKFPKAVCETEQKLCRLGDDLERCGK